MSYLGPYPFYGGRVQLWFDPVKHIYYRQIADNYFEPQHGVTSVVKIIDKSLYLTPWTAKKVVEKVFRLMPKVEHNGGLFTRPMPLAQFEALLNVSKSAPKDILDDAGDIGSMAHKCIEDSIKAAGQGNVMSELVNLPVNDKAQKCSEAALDWIRRHNVRFVETERKVYSLQYECAGTMDGLAYVDSCDNPLCCPETFWDILSIIDWKSSNYLHTEYCYQTAAYEAFYEEEFNVDVVDRWVLQLGKDTGRFNPWHFGPDYFEPHFNCFLLCLDLKRHHESVEDTLKKIGKLAVQNRREARALAKKQKV